MRGTVTSPVIAPGKVCTSSPGGASKAMTPVGSLRAGWCVCPSAAAHTRPRASEVGLAAGSHTHQPRPPGPTGVIALTVGEVLVLTGRWARSERRGRVVTAARGGGRGGGGVPSSPPAPGERRESLARQRGQDLTHARVLQTFPSALHAAAQGRVHPITFQPVHRAPDHLVVLGRTRQRQGRGGEAKGDVVVAMGRPAVRGRNGSGTARRA